MITIITVLIASIFELSLFGTYFGAFILDLYLLDILSDYVNKKKKD